MTGSVGDYRDMIAPQAGNRHHGYQGLRYDNENDLPLKLLNTLLLVASSRS